VSAEQISIIRLWDVLLVPLQGDVTDRHAEHLTDTVLHRLAQSRARGLVVDVSGVALIDSHLCAMIASLAASARLMGTRSFVAGLSAEVAMTLETMGVSFKQIETTRGLEEALAQFDIGLANASGGG
jgi:rsbT antagonist protein RsbS